MVCPVDRPTGWKAGLGRRCLRRGRGNLVGDHRVRRRGLPRDVEGLMAVIIERIGVSFGVLYVMSIGSREVYY